MSSKRKSVDELRDLSDAIDEAILGASDAEIIEDLTQLGINPEKADAEMDAFTQEAKKMAGRLRLASAKEAVVNFRRKPENAAPSDRTALRAKFESMRAGTGRDSMMMAARKGKHLSADDEDGALDDLAQLQALEAEDPEASNQ